MPCLLASQAEPTIPEPVYPTVATTRAISRGPCVPFFERGDRAKPRDLSTHLDLLTCRWPQVLVMRISLLGRRPPEPITANFPGAAPGGASSDPSDPRQTCLTGGGGDQQGLSAEPQEVLGRGQLEDVSRPAAGSAVRGSRFQLELAALLGQRENGKEIQDPARPGKGWVRGKAAAGELWPPFPWLSSPLAGARFASRWAGVTERTTQASPWKVGKAESSCTDTAGSPTTTRGSAAAGPLPRFHL